MSDRDFESNLSLLTYEEPEHIEHAVETQDLYTGTTGETSPNSLPQLDNIGDLTRPSFASFAKQKPETDFPPIPDSYYISKPRDGDFISLFYDSIEFTEKMKMSEEANIYTLERSVEHSMNSQRKLIEAYAQIKQWYNDLESNNEWRSTKRNEVINFSSQLIMEIGNYKFIHFTASLKVDNMKKEFALKWNQEYKRETMNQITNPNLLVEKTQQLIHPNQNTSVLDGKKQETPEVVSTKNPLRKIGNSKLHKPAPEELKDADLVRSLKTQKRVEGQFRDFDEDILEERRIIKSKIMKESSLVSNYNSFELDTENVSQDLLNEEIEHALTARAEFREIAKLAETTRREEIQRNADTAENREKAKIAKFAADKTQKTARDNKGSESNEASSTQARERMGKSGKKLRKEASPSIVGPKPPKHPSKNLLAVITSILKIDKREPVKLEKEPKIRNGPSAQTTSQFVKNVERTIKNHKTPVVIYVKKDSLVGRIPENQNKVKDLERRLSGGHKEISSIVEQLEKNYKSNLKAPENYESCYFEESPRKLEEMAEPFLNLQKVRGSKKERLNSLKAWLKEAPVRV